MKTAPVLGRPANTWLNSADEKLVRDTHKCGR